jgi:D-alanyl-D-alanine carboxypeptidase
MLVSTVNDLVKWDAALRSETLLKKSILEQMWTPTKLSKGGDAEYGFGWSIGKVNGHRLIGHGGGIPGFSTQLSRYVDDNLTVIVLTNADSGNAGALARGIAGRLVPALAEEAAKPIADTDPQTTERLKGVILAAMKGEADPELFTKESKERHVAAIKQGKGTTASFGALREFRLEERKQSDQGVKLRYRAIFENETMSAFFDLDKAGKIAGLGLQSAD